MKRFGYMVFGSFTTTVIQRESPMWKSERNGVLYFGGRGVTVFLDKKTAQTAIEKTKAYRKKIREGENDLAFRLVGTYR